jgi:hypothetical protein
MNEKSGKTKEKIMKYSILFLLLFGLNLQAQNRVSETTLPQNWNLHSTNIWAMSKNFIRWLKQLI